MSHNSQHSENFYDCSIYPSFGFLTTSASVKIFQVFSVEKYNPKVVGSIVFALSSLRSNRVLPLATLGFIV